MNREGKKDIEDVFRLMEIYDYGMSLKQALDQIMCIAFEKGHQGQDLVDYVMETFLDAWDKLTSKEVEAVHFKNVRLLVSNLIEKLVLVRLGMDEIDKDDLMDRLEEILDERDRTNESIQRVALMN